MKFTLSALRSWINCPLTALQLAKQLTLTGLETTLIPSELVPFQGVVAGEIIHVQAHPNADRLRICKVHCGSEEKSIVCGASNVRVGLKVAVAQIGAELPQGLVIQPRVIRGVQSEGMLCSLTELGLQEVFARDAINPGIWELPNDIPLGVHLWEHMKWGEPTLDTQVPPNRGDCLSILGIAREIAALNRLEWSPVKVMPVNATQSEIFTVKVIAPEACPRYVCRVLRGLNSTVPTPWWITQRLWREGIRSINAIVDITNYILLEWGAPLHAFDLKRLSGSIEVRYARPQETLCLLNNKKVDLRADTLVIADAEGVQALAGIMGGLSSSVTDSTTDILLESAFFSPEAIAGHARYYGLMTDASYRFERGVDPALCLTVIEYATALLLDLCGGKAGPLNKVEYASALPAIPTLTLSDAKLQKVLGIQLPDSVLIEGLTHLGLVTVASESAHTKIWKGKRPSWRFDLNEEVDLIEEVLRWHGYEHIPAKIPTFPVGFHSHHEVREQIHRMRNFLAAQGYYETLNYSFTSARYQQQLDPNNLPITLENPISNKLNVLRTQLWPGLLTTLQYNQHHRQQPYAFFEVGTVFLAEADKITEQCHIGGVVSGSALPEQWGVSSRHIDYFDVKNVVQNALNLLDNQGSYTYQSSIHPALHPGQSSAVFHNGKQMGWIGALHPKLYTQFDLVEPVYLFEWRLPEKLHSKQVTFKSFSNFPYMRRDIAFWVDKNVSFETLRTVILENAGSYLQDLRLFDIYQHPVNSMQRSIALGLLWQHTDRTLTEQEVDKWQVNIIHALQSQCGVVIRE
jgi:phenylalanyl-tRNA synthetase beta chain